MLSNFTWEFRLTNRNLALNKERKRLGGLKKLLRLSELCKARRNNMRQLLIYGCAIIATLVPCSLAVAQFAEQNRIASYTWQGAARKAFRSPASNILGRPTVSPYLALADLTGMGQIDTSRNYFTQVRPQLENRRRVQQQQRSLRRVQQEVQKNKHICSIYEPFFA